MGKEEISTTKYLIHAQINANGIVEKPDVVGAIFGQTEGLLSNDLDLRELQKTGRIGRIKVNITSRGGKSKGEIIIPSSLDRVETAILAASLETINRVGPCEAYIQVTKVEDVRAVKRKRVVERAKEIYASMMEEVTPESLKMIEEVKEAMRVHEITEYGEEKLPAGPNVETSDAILVVEGRSDVLNLLKYGIKNAIAVEGVSVPKTVADLTRKKTVTAFVDGDRGGELILKELLQVGEIDYVTRAPKGKEVEDLEKDEIMMALRNKVPVEQFYHDLGMKKEKKKTEDKMVLLRNILKELEGTGNAEILDDALNILREVKVENLYDELSRVNNHPYAVVFDGVITQRLVDLSFEKGLRYLVAVRSGDIVKKPHNLKLITGHT
ncbi:MULTISPECIES: DNA primase DnaG [Methanothermobacter]|jgi:DNA primase|uniref:DNA primase DnaG n=1 Tax=Methanothermobacter thermautotrophicus TaxID=145262 RepID=A0A7J4MWS0_METTF|nr:MULTISPECIES: DNA primase DnaG [Methanothermobacter]MDK2875361.1 primase [Methanothermobacter sp.]MDI6818769.1 DNA primase DnaG [Methanothermobacter thermautotrophicus]MDN5374280.1 primase [Methanothermobacter sp.]WBF07106.1 DNA primase [Methanothermobacter thermautotrophicus]WBF08898.1 DNA primase [Methanothermobacter thermautotrophicus]